MSLKEPREASTSFPLSPSRACSHSRLISDNVSEEEHKAGKVRCVECGGVIPDPYLHQTKKGQ